MADTKKNRLFGLRCYLSGPIDRVPDCGVGWRKWVSTWLCSRGVIVFDPCFKPNNDCTPETDRRSRHAMVEQGDWDGLTACMKKIRGMDLRLVNTCDFLILHVDPNVHMCGSYEEVAIATHEKKPIITHVEGGKSRTPWWLFGQIPHEHIFGHWQEVLSYLGCVDEDENFEAASKRWFFFDKDYLYNSTVLKSRDG